MEQVVESRPRLLTASEVAAQLGVRPAFVYDLARRRLLPVIHVGRYCRFDPVALTRWVEEGGVADETLEDMRESPRLRDRKRRR